ESWMALPTVVLPDGPRERAMKRRGSRAAAAAVALTIFLGAGAWQASASSVWAVVPTPNVGSDINELSASSALSSTDAWAVGSFEDSSLTTRTLIEHWNGSRWKIIASPNPDPVQNDLLGVAAVSASDVWAVGFSGQEKRVLVEHWNGTAWSVVATPGAGT